MNKRLPAIVTLICMSTLTAWTGQWTYDSFSGLLSHDTSDWVLVASLIDTNLTVTGVSQAPSSPSALPLNDPVPGYSLVSLGKWAFESCSSLSDVTIPDSVTTIGVQAFYGCGSLADVFIGNGVTTIGYYAFYGCGSLLSINVATGNMHFASADGILYIKNLTELIQCPCMKTGSVVVPASVTRIGYSAFESCYNISEVTIPDSVTTIGAQAFYGCGSLADVSIGNGVTTIEDYAFYGCNALTALVLPAGLRSIGYSTLAVCGSLTAVTFEGSFPDQAMDGVYGGGGCEPFASGATTSYVYAAHVAGWEPYVTDGPLADGRATWQGCPIRVLPNPVTGFTVTLDKQGGSFLGPTSKTVTYGNAYGSLPVPTRANYVFDGWRTGINGSGMPVFPTSMVSCARDHTLYAKWFADVTDEAAPVLGTTNLVWLTGDFPFSWMADEVVSYNGNGAMRSTANQPDGMRSVLQTRVTGPGVLQFHWKASTENGCDFLQFLVDGSERVDGLSGETGWKKVTVAIPAGEHVLEWAYEKDGSAYDGSDCGWLDQVVWPAVPHTPEANFWLWESALFGSSWLPDYLFAARDGFTARIEATPNDVTSRVYRAVASIATLTENAELRALTEAFGLSLDTNLFAAAGAFTGTNAPPCNEAIDRAAAQMLPAIDAALADLDAIPADWSGAVEITSEDSGFDETVYVDLADVLLAKSMLYTVRAAVRLAQAYDLTADYSKTNVTQEIVAPFDLPSIADPFNDSGFSAWDSVPAHLFGENGPLECAEFARTETQALLLLQMADGAIVDEVHAHFRDANGIYGPFDYIDVNGVPENQLTACTGYGRKYVLENPDCPECGGWYERVEVEYTVLKSGGSLLIATDAEWGETPFQVAEAGVSVQWLDALTENYTGDRAEWATKSRIQPVSRFLEDHPNFLKTVRDAAKLPAAKESLRSALLAVQAADTSITGRTGEAWHFIEFAPDQTNWMAEARQKLTESLASLDAPLSVRICHTNEKEIVNGYWDDNTSEWVVSSTETQRTEVVNLTEVVHLGAVFEPPYLTRTLAPRFSEDNEIVLGTFADPTFGGVFPEWTALHVETNLIGRVPVMRERAFQMGGQWFHTGGHALWSYSDGGGWGELAQSGEVRLRGRVSWVETTVAGPGTLDFSLALTETENRESSLIIHVDGVRQVGGTIRGDSGWMPRQLEIPAGRHRVRWTYTLEDDWTVDAGAESSLGWLTDFAWAPESASDHTVTTPVEVPHAWLDGYPSLFGAGDDYESVALADGDGDGQATWAEFLAGTDPVDPSSALMALIRKDGPGLEIGWTPDLTPARAYTVEGKADLQDAAWGPTNAATHFFRVKVSLP